MSEEKQNILFVQNIENYPCLYDYTRNDYSKRSASDKAWNAVSKEAGIPVSECKEKWKNLRTALKRSQSKLPSGSEAKKKKYYLHDVMSFLLPFLKSRPQSGNLPSPPTDDDTDVVEEMDNNTSKSATESTVAGNVEETSSYRQESQFRVVEQSTESKKLPLRPKHFAHLLKKRNPAQPTTSTMSDEADKCFVDYMKQQTNTAPPNADMEFLQSLLPDVMKMDCRRKRRFKRSALELIDNILADQEDEERQRSVGPTASPTSSDWSYGSPPTSAAEYLATWPIE